MAGPVTRGKTRIRAVFAALALLLGGLAGPPQIESAELRPLAPPEDAPRLSPGPDGRVLMLLDIPGQSPGVPVTVTLHPFWDEDARTFDFRLEGPDAAPDGKTATTETGQPIQLKAEGIPEGRVVWGLLETRQDGDPKRLPLVLGAFGPAVEDADSLDVTPNGQAQLTLDISRHRAFGKKARFELTPFSAQGQPAEILFPDPAGEGPATTSLEVELPETGREITLEIDARSLRAETDYAGALRTTIGEHRFIDTKLVVKRRNWQAGAAFSEIADRQGPGPLGLTLSAAGDQTVRGFWVANLTGAADDFLPSEHLEITLDGEPLEPLDPRNPEQVRRRTLEPGEIKEIVVAAKEALPPGSYDVALRFGASNVEPENWQDVKVTLVKRRHLAWPIGVLVVAVLLSYATTKGLSAMIQRRDLRRRITEIQKKSWLRSDRWGALPVVRAFGRAKMADLALSLRLRWNLLTWLSRFVTTPQLLVDEVKEVEDRMEVLKRLNALAIYWNAAPSASGAMVTDFDERVVNRAQKILRGIVDRLGQVQEGEDVGTEIMDEIAALEAWEARQKLTEGYWASLSGDIQLLLDAVDLDHFDFDGDTRLHLEGLLRTALGATTKPAEKQALEAALKAAKTAAQEGVAALRESPLPAGIADADATESDLQALEACEREVVRRLCQALDLTTSPGPLSEMIQMERTYTRLKLIWEQRNDDERRPALIEKVRNNTPVETILKDLDDDVWERLKAEGTVRIVPPDAQQRIEEYQPIDFKLECTDPKANTFLFKHGLEYEWTIDWDGERQLKPITRSTVVTQFVPQEAEVKVGVIVRRGRESFSIGLAHDQDASGKVAFVEGSKTFKTAPTSAFKHLWPTPTPELIGIAIALILALVTGLQSDVFDTAVAGSWKEYLALFAWGIAADQTKNLLANLDSLTKGEGPAKA